MSSSNNSNNNKPEIPIPDGEAEKIIDQLKTELPDFSENVLFDLSQFELVPIDGSGKRVEVTDEKKLKNARNVKLTYKKQQKPGDHNVYDFHFHALLSALFPRLHYGNWNVPSNTEKYKSDFPDSAQLSMDLCNRQYDKKDEDRTERGKSQFGNKQMRGIANLTFHCLKWFLVHKPSLLDKDIVTVYKEVQESFKKQTTELDEARAEYKQDKDALLKAGFANKVAKMEANIKQLEAKTDSLDSAIIDALVKKERLKLPAVINDKHEGDLTAIKAECKVYRDATEEEKKTYLPSVRLPKYPERLLVPAGEAEKWQCPILKSLDPVTGKDVLFFDPEYVELYRKTKGQKIYSMARWMQTDGRVVPFHALTSSVNPQDGKTQHPAISGAIVCPKLFVRIGFKLGQNKKMFGLKFTLAQTPDDNFWIRGWQPMPRIMQITDSSSSMDTSSGTETKKRFPFSKPLTGSTSFDTSLWSKKDKNQQQQQQQDGSGNSADLYRPYDDHKTPVTPSEPSMGDWTMQHQEDLKAQKEMEIENGDQAMVAIMAQSSPLEHDELAMMEAPVLLKTGKGEKRKAEGEPEAPAASGSKRGGGSKKQKLT